MITITGKYAIHKEDEYCKFYEVNLPFDKFDEICDDAMPIKKSDEIIRAKIKEKYGDNPEKIFVDAPKGW